MNDLLGTVKPKENAIQGNPAYDGTPDTDVEMAEVGGGGQPMVSRERTAAYLWQ